MLCLSFKILKCFVIYIPLLNTQPKKKKKQRQKGFDEIINMEKYMLCFRGKKTSAETVGKRMNALSQNSTLFSFLKGT